MDLTIWIILKISFLLYAKDLNKYLDNKKVSYEYTIIINKLAFAYKILKLSIKLVYKVLN